MRLFVTGFSSVDKLEMNIFESITTTKMFSQCVEDVRLRYTTLAGMALVSNLFNRTLPWN